jgi:hypothetical protein
MFVASFVVTMDGVIHAHLIHMFALETERFILGRSSSHAE